MQIAMLIKHQTLCMNISSFNAFSNYHSFWSHAFNLLKIRYFNSTLSKNTLNHRQYGCFMTLYVSEINSVKYLENSNSSGVTSIFCVESIFPAFVEYVNLLHDETTPNLFAAHMHTSFNNKFKFVYAFGN